MVHDLIPMAVNIKIHTFEKPARLVNAMELACALGMAYAQAGMPMPEVQAGMSVREFWDETVPEIKDNEAVMSNLRIAILNYIFKKDDYIDENALITLKLGYKI